MNARSDLITHCGARVVTRDELDGVEAPPATETWSWAAEVPTSTRLTCLILAVSQFLAPVLTSSTTLSRERWIQSRSWAAQTEPRSGGWSTWNWAGRSRASLGAAGRAWVRAERTWMSNGPRYRAAYEAIVGPLS